MRYDKSEEKIIVESWIIGAVFSFPIGLMLSLHLDFLDVNLPMSIIELLMFYWTFFGYICLFWWMTAVSSSLVLWKRHYKSKLSKKDIQRLLFSTITIPFIWAYVPPITVFIFNNVNVFLLQFLSPVGTFWIGALLFFPFMLIGVCILLPDLRSRLRHRLPSLFTTRFWKKLGNNKEVKRDIKIGIVLLVIYIVVKVLTWA